MCAFRSIARPGSGRTRSWSKTWFRHFLMNITEFNLKWVHMARYGLILRQERAIWFRIISKTYLTKKGLYKIPNDQTSTNIPDISTSLPLAYHGYHKPTLGCLVWVYDPCFCQKGGHKPTLVIPMSLQKYGGHFSWKNSLRATYPQARGFQKYGGHFSEKHKTALSNIPTS